ncbi:phosphatidate cytidylyltransferase [Nitrospirillum sp. BR 11164]|uniref:phosphatidate cytidylyltransferase n=1 Tax=Nitrospirillum sp. BR 11164 TaxID=3104324 RepID=UPI002AFF9375|nr:phosphatidate cytidylyltransferase [Nitrospirillum sp. BR 11164]MEA1650681.1 phosphatidate cytidylyltransferase [Nitrospirillum sp. BR 11164]
MERAEGLLAKLPGDLKTRIFSALVLGPPVLVAVWLGGIVFQLVLVAVAVIAGLEWLRLVVPGRQPWATAMGLMTILVTLSGEFVAGPLYALVLLAAQTALLWWAAAGGHPRVPEVPDAGQGGRLPAPILFALIVPYVGGGCLALDWIRNRAGPDAPWLFLFLLLAIWATDIGAYAAGRTIGGPKLAPRISPKKTWAGLLGGMAAAALVGLALSPLATVSSPGAGALVAAVIAVVGQAGDLFESYMKRRCDVKDSGSLIPGHGGLLDRIDGLVMAAPVFALFHALIGENGSWW